ncbi:MAG: tetratricopeptide repeat protein, partial [Pseudolabrys sp.]
KRETEIALALNPNYALAWNTRGNAEAYSGHPLAAIPYFERAMRLDPAFTQQYIHFLASAYLVAGQYKAAEDSFRERIRLATRNRPIARPANSSAWPSGTDWRGSMRLV